jgi:hypothetical protein
MVPLALMGVRSNGRMIGRPCMTKILAWMTWLMQQMNRLEKHLNKGDTHENP